jgi:Flp pilus assembly protein TadD
MALELCSLALPASASQGATTAGNLVGIAMVGICSFLPPIAVIALSVFARDDFRRRAVAVVAEEELIPTGDAADYYNRGLRRSKRGRMDQAVTDFEEAVRLRPGDITYRNVLALAYAEQKGFAQAVEQLEAALQIQPNDQVTLDNLQIVRDLQTKG